MKPIVIVDDEVDIHTVTRMSLKHLRFDNEPVQFESLHNGEDAVDYLKRHPDTPLVLMDVVMEAENSGLIAVQRIREELKNTTVRIVLRTGQPGIAPEKEIIDNYDIDGYLAKSEMTSNRLYTTVRSALKTHAEITALQRHRDLLSLMHQSSLKLHRAQSLDSCLQHLLEVTEAALPSPLTWVYLHTPEREKESHLLYVGRDEAELLEQKSTNLLVQVKAEQRRLRVESPCWFGQGFLVSLDLHAEKGYGFLYVERQDDPVFFSRVLPIFANHTIAALESLGVED